MKIFLTVFLLFTFHLFIFSQEKDSVVIRDSSGIIISSDSAVIRDSLNIIKARAQDIDSLPYTGRMDTVLSAVTVDTIPPAGSVDTAASAQTTAVKKKHSPRKATIRSAIIPGWGQVYNRKYWKVPIVYAVIGVPANLFIYNRKWYNKTRYALSIVANDRYHVEDSMARVDPKLRLLVDRKAEGSLINYRNEFRKDMDYSVLFTLLAWGLNVVDATVDGHLRSFDVSDELGIKIKPSFIPGTMTPAISLVVNFK